MQSVESTTHCHYYMNEHEQLKHLFLILQRREIILREEIARLQARLQW